MEIPALKDVIQATKGNLETPEIRVWCHPHRINEQGDDYYLEFYTFQAAEKYIKEHPEAEEYPLIAFRGFELHIYKQEALLPVVKEKK